MEGGRFEDLVFKALSELPVEFQERLENIDVVVEDSPSPSQLARVGVRRGSDLLGLYEGVPQTRRTHGYSLVPPDKITIFRKPIEARCRGDKEIEQEVQRVVRHEIAHHFGIGDRRLAELEREG